MNARQEISDLLRRWRELSQAEFKAIQAGDWPGLKTLQTAKDELQKALSNAREVWNAQNPARPLPTTDGSHPFAGEISALVALETQNEQLLEARRQMLRERKELLRTARQNVRRIRRSYAGKTEAKWHFYS